MPDVAGRLEDLIRFDTRNPEGDERALARHLAGALEGHRPDVLEVVEVGRHAYVWARWGEPRLLLNAHLDTVPANTGWTGSPHQPRREGGRLFGLGACDTKGAIAAALDALDEVRPKNAAVLFSGDEERGGSCVRDFLASSRARGVERAVVCEPTGCRVGTRHRGILAVSARVDGEGGHSSRADLLPAPIADLARLAAGCDAWGKLRREEGPPGFKGMCMNVAKLEGGVAFNVVPDSATLSVSIRPPPGAEMELVHADLLAMAARIVPAAQVTVELSNPPFQTRDLEAFRPWLGEAVDRPLDMGFWTEAAILSQAGIDAVVFGPGDIAQAHAPDEWVPLAELDVARRAFLKVLHGSG
jgi:acetylornithine deacetylase